MKHQVNRVVVTGMGVVAPNAHGLEDFTSALRGGKSGVRFDPRLAELGFRCQISGAVPALDELSTRYFEPGIIRRMDPHCTLACIAGLDAWKDAGLTASQEGPVDWETGIKFGVGFGALPTIAGILGPQTDSGKIRRLGASMVEKTMMSSVTAHLARLLGTGGQCSTVSSACATGLQAILEGVRDIHEGRVSRVVAGGSESDSPYVWAMFDALQVLCADGNENPEKASRPLSAGASGFVPAAGAGAVVLESLDSALERGARIYGEIAGGAMNCGGQRNGGTMTAANPEGIERCIRAALDDSGIRPEEIDLISGHTTATKADPLEVGSWLRALGCSEAHFPLINAPKSMFGHTLGAAGAIESIAALLQLHQGFVHPSINCEEPHPQLTWCGEKIPRSCLERDLQVVAKSAFGFGDVNATVLYRRFENQA